MKGKFIVFEGIDGSGKTTASKLFSNNLKIPNARWCAPAQEGAGAVIRRYLAGESHDPIEMPLLFTADRVQINRRIRNMIETGTTVVLDRYALSTWAYQRGVLPDDLLMHLCLDEPFHIMPDLLVHISVTVKTAMERLSARPGAASIFEKKEEIERVHRLYNEALHGIIQVPESSCLMPVRPYFCKGFVEIDNNGDEKLLRKEMARLAKEIEKEK